MRRLKEDYSLRRQNTFGIDVRAVQYAEFSNIEELQNCLSEADYAPWVLGGGSNILLINDLQRCVLHNAISGISIVDESEGYIVIRAGAGVVWHDLVTWCIEKNFGGLENLALIPGTVGAAPLQNIGAYGRELTETFVSLRAMRLTDNHERTFFPSECEFSYRDSVFKRQLKDQYCIMDVDLRLTKPPHLLKTDYGAIRDELKKRNVDEPGIKDVYDVVIAIRSSKLPDPVRIGNAGSFFKNPVVDESLYQSLISAFPKMPVYHIEDGQHKIPAGWLIEQCGWKGRRVGNVGCYEKQALVIVNYGGASGREIFDHAMQVRDSVQERFGIELQTEVNVIST